MEVKDSKHCIILTPKNCKPGQLGGFSQRVLQSALGMTHVFRERLVMGYADY